MFEGQWNFGSIPLQDSWEASETSQNGTFLPLNRGEKNEKTAGTRGRHKSPLAADSLVNENAHYASIGIRSKRSLTAELPAMAAAALQKLLAAVRVSDIVEMSRLLKLGAPVNEPIPDDDALGMCCLHYAALRGRQHISDPVPKGVDDGPEGGTRAAAMVAVLCDAGAEVNMCDSMGFTALHLAASVGDDEVVAELLNRGAFMDVQDDEVNYTPMHAAAEAGQVGAMLLLIEAGAFVDEQVVHAINEALGIRIRSGGQRTGVRSFASSAAQNQLVDSRDSSMLPNGGGRLSDLKDVTGKSIWDVMDQPATAFGLLEVLIADVAHVDVIKARSLIELLQQTQAVRQLSHIMQRALAEEGKAAGVPWSALMPQWMP